MYRIEYCSGCNGWHIYGHPIIWPGFTYEKREQAVRDLARYDKQGV